MRSAARTLIRAVAFFLLRVSRFGERASRALAISTFPRAEIDALAVAEWEAFGGSPPADDALFAWETELFANHIRLGDAVLVVGAGTGRDVLPLLEAGHEVTALDIAPLALAALGKRSRGRGFRVPVIQGSIVEADLSSRAFDVVLFSWFCFSYLHGPDERRAALARSASVLRTSGRILLSYPRRSHAAAPAPSISKLRSWIARLLGGTEVESGDEFMVTGTANQPSVYFTHPFAPGDIVVEAQRAGLFVAFHGQPTPSVGVAVLSRAEEVAR